MSRVRSLAHLPRLVALGLLRFYKRAISPLLPPSCRYWPTCSEYCSEAVQRFGALRGSWLGLLRLLRCHPFAKGGFDPVPGDVSSPRRKRGRTPDDGCRSAGPRHGAPPPASS